MASFSDQNFVKKLGDLNNSQQSIQTLSLWLIHHRKHAKTIVQVWIRELQKAKKGKKLVFLYLSNDVVQNSKKKGPEFAKQFATVLPSAYAHTATACDEKTKGSMERMVNIWKERGVFPDSVIDKLKNALKGNAGSATSSPQASSKGKSTDEQPPKKKKKPDLSLKEELEQHVLDQPMDPPETEELAKALQDLDNAASSDADVREKIAGLPKEVSDVSFLENITDKISAEALLKQVESACVLLAEYNARLAGELEDRRHVARMLRDFISKQKEEVVESEKKLVEYKEKLEKVSAVRKELTSHIQSLPDMTLLPDVTGGLMPLPSAGDLFGDR